VEEGTKVLLHLYSSQQRNNLEMSIKMRAKALHTPQPKNSKSSSSRKSPMEILGCRSLLMIQRQMNVSVYALQYRKACISPSLFST